MLKIKLRTQVGTQDYYAPELIRATSVLKHRDLTGNYNFYNVDGWGTPNPAKASVTGTNLYSYDAVAGKWFYSAPGQTYLDIVASFPTAVTYDITLANISGAEMTGNFPQSIYVFNTLFIMPIDEQARPTIAIVADVICRKLQELSDDILYQKTCSAKCRQYDELSRVWNLCWNQLVRTEIDFMSYSLSDYADINEMNADLLLNPELAKCVSLYKEALAIATQEIDCNGCK